MLNYTELVRRIEQDLVYIHLRILFHLRWLVFPQPKEGKFPCRDKILNTTLVEVKGKPVRGH